MFRTLKPNTTAAISATMLNINAAFRAAEIICARTYSSIDSGAMNILLKLCDQTFQSGPSVIEYCEMRTISHSSVPIYRYCAAVGFITDDRKRVTKPNMMTV